ncbi:uncharacterized protein LOC114266475 [Camellia sinensis]|uniref:uncharacterized protein LOC114266475 n=1 Tax=Camellia sinensis TaxID=4442 RepID=UPI00103576C7|nr:uncharacterized protein LOC114266475 [Camellia sinensis]
MTQHLSLGPVTKKMSMEKEAKRRANLVKKITEMFISGGKVEEMEEFFSTPVAPVCETPNMAAIGCFWTTLGSVVYCFGDTRGSHIVKYWDLAEIQKGMEALSPGVVLAPTVVQRRGQNRIHFWALKEVLLVLSDDPCFPLLFFHLHDETFCLIWEDYEYSAGCQRSVLLVHQFCVSKRIKRGVLGLSVKPVFTEYYLPDGIVINSFDGIVLNMGGMGVTSGSGGRASTIALWEWFRKVLVSRHCMTYLILVFVFVNLLNNLFLMLYYKVCVES